MKKRMVGLAITGLVVIAACGDTATQSPNHENWIITPDLSLHHAEPLLTGTGQCGNGVVTWINRSGEFDADRMTQGETIVVPCGSGNHTVGTWGLDDRIK